MKYVEKDELIIRDENTYIPKDLANRDYQDYLEWLAEGNTATIWQPSLDELKQTKRFDLQSTIDLQEHKAVRSSQDLMAFGNDYPNHALDLQALIKLRTAIRQNGDLIARVNIATTKEEIENIEPIKVVI